MNFARIPAKYIMDWPASASAHHHHHTTALPIGPASASHARRHPPMVHVTPRTRREREISSKAASEQPVMNGCERAVIGHWLHGLCGHRMRAHHRGAVPTADARDGFHIAPSASALHSSHRRPSSSGRAACGHWLCISLHDAQRPSPSTNKTAAVAVDALRSASATSEADANSRPNASRRTPRAGLQLHGQGSQHWPIDKPPPHLHVTNIHDDEALVHCGSISSVSSGVSGRPHRAVSRR